VNNKIKPIITVGIVTHNRREELMLSIRSVYNQGLDNIEILVVDNNSEDGTMEALQKEFPSVRIIRLEENLGCPGGRNYIYDYARGEYIINLDDDGFLESDTVKKVIKTFESNPKIGIIAMRQCYPDEEIEPYRDGKDFSREVGIFRGGVSAFRSAMLRETGYYPHNFFFYKEEEDLALRALERGWKIIFHPGIIMRHPRQNRSDRILEEGDYYLFRNPLLVVINNFPGRYLWQYLVGRIISCGLISLKRKTFRQYLHAVRDVIRALPKAMKNRSPCRKRTIQKYLELRKKSSCVFS